MGITKTAVTGEFSKITRESLNQVTPLTETTPIFENPYFQQENEETSWGSVRISRKSEINYNIVLPDGDYTIKKNDRYIICVGSSASTVYLPKGEIGKMYTVKNNSGGAVTVDARDSYIDGLSTKVLAATYNAVTLIFYKEVGAGGFLGLGEWAIVNEI